MRGRRHGALSRGLRCTELFNRHVVENDVGHRSRDALQFRQSDGQCAAVVDLRDILDPIVADVLIGAAAEGDAADHAVLDILVVFEAVLVEIKFFNVLSYLKLDGARTCLLYTSPSPRA